MSGLEPYLLLCMTTSMVRSLNWCTGSQSHSRSLASAWSTFEFWNVWLQLVFLEIAPVFEGHPDLRIAYTTDMIGFNSAKILSLMLGLFCAHIKIFQFLVTDWSYCIPTFSRSSQQNRGRIFTIFYSVVCVLSSVTIPWSLILYFAFYLLFDTRGIIPWVC